MRPKILIILGDEISRFVQASGVIRDVREQRPDAHITLLAHRTLRELVEPCPWIDDYSYDEHVSFLPNPMAYMRHRTQMGVFLRQFELVLDFQHDAYTKRYMHWHDPSKWSSSHEGAKYFVHPQIFEQKALGDALQVQLSQAKLHGTYHADMSYLVQNEDEFLEKHGLEEGKYIVLIPGTRKTHKQRRWPHYEALGGELQRRNIPIVVVGSLDERDVIEELGENLQATVIFKPDLHDLATVFRHARYVIGNDTGPFHIATACGAHGTILFGPDSKTKQRKTPQNPNATLLEHADNLAALSPQQVLKTIPNLS